MVGKLTKLLQVILNMNYTNNNKIYFKIHRIIITFKKLK